MRKGINEIFHVEMDYKANMGINLAVASFLQIILL